MLSLLCAGDQCEASDCISSIKYSKIGDYCSNSECEQNTQECCDDRNLCILRTAHFSAENFAETRELRLLAFQLRFNGERFQSCKDTSTTCAYHLRPLNHSTKCVKNANASLTRFLRISQASGDCLEKSAENTNASLARHCGISHQRLHGCVTVNALPKLIYWRATFRPRNRWCEIS